MKWDYDRVLITGAAGALGEQLRKSGTRLAAKVRLTDRVSPSLPIEGHEDSRLGDLADRYMIDSIVEGCEAVVHLGGRALEDTFDVILNSNIVGTYNIYESARKHDVKRIVYASSIHTVGYYERTETIDAAASIRPDSLYGVSKAFGESLGRYYYDKFGIETVCLRIGSCFPQPTDRRHLVTWLSYRDFRQLVELSLSAERVGYMVCFATSRNSRSFWDNRAASVLGYKPQDSADDFEESLFATTQRGEPNDPAVRYQGGTFCTASICREEGA